MTEEEAQQLKERDPVYFPANPARMATSTGNKKKRGDETYVEIQEAVRRSWVRAKIIETVKTVPTIKEKIEQYEFASNESLRQHLVFNKLNGRLVDVIYSMEATNTDFMAYQYKAVLKMLDSPGKGILIADEVGLGKTIEAGLIWTELKARYNYNRILVVCPANLKKKWVSELWNRFSTDATECSGAKDVKESIEKGLRPGQGFASVCSYQSLLPPSEEHGGGPQASLHALMDDLDTEEPSIDLLVVDEAHYVRNRKTKTNSAIASIAQMSENVVLLSATPVHATSSNLFSLLNILDDGFFELEHEFETMVNANRPIIQAIRSLPPGQNDVTSLRSHVHNALNNSYFRDNSYLNKVSEMLALEKDWSKPKNRTDILEPLEKVNLFNQYVVRNRKRDVLKDKVKREVNTVYVDLSIDERNVYQCVIDSVFDYMDQNDINNEGFILSGPERQISSSICGTLRYWGSTGIGNEEEKNKKTGPLLNHLKCTVPERCDGPALKRNDNKYNQLVNTLNDYLSVNPGKKLILFSFYKTTLDYLYERLNEDNFESTLITGDFNPAERWNRIEDFRKKSSKILLSSEVGSEGIDLQFCSAIINYDLPWNPMKIEQRIGRIDRIGQEEEKIIIFNFVCINTIDHSIYDKLWKKISVFENTLGDIELILEENIEDLTNSIYDHELSRDDIENKIIQKAAAVENILQQERELEEKSADLVAFYDVVTQKIENARSTGKWVSAEDVQFLIRDFLKRGYPETEFKASSGNDHEWEIKLSKEASFDYRSYLELNPSLKDNSILTDQKFIRIRFSDRSGPSRGKGYREVIDQFHPLVRFATNEMQDDMESGNFSYHPLIKCSVDRKLIQDNKIKEQIKDADWLFFYIERWSFTSSQKVKKLFYISANSDGIVLDDIDSENIINQACVEDSRMTSIPDIDNAILFSLLNNLKDISHESFSKYKENLAEEFQNKAEIQKSGLRRSASNRIENAEEKAHEKRLSNDERTALSIEGKIKKMRERLAERIDDINGRLQDLDSEFEDICAGIIILN
jgi:superfamily II DNA or RNA helicase